jgi:alcohol dehydrogenase
MSLHNSPDKKYLIQMEEYTRTNIVFGEGAFAQLGEHLLLNRIARASFVFGGKNSYINGGICKAFTHMISGFEIDSPNVTDVPPEPDCDDVRRIVAAFNEQQPQVVVAAGGGSVMDAAKAAYLSWQTGLDVSELFGVDVASNRFPGKEFDRVICIPTTAGTGSEVTPYSNIVDPETKVKRLIMEKQIVPEYAFVEHCFTKTCSPSLTVTTALDALVHSIESFLNTKSATADPASDDWAIESIKLIRYALPLAMKEPDNLLYREMLCAGATLGGMCISCRPTSLPHLCSFSLYGKIPHGLAVAGFLPMFWRYYLADSDVRKQTMRLAGIFASDMPQTTPESVVDAVEQFILSFTPSMKLTEEETAKIASDASGNPMKLSSAPRPVTLDNAADIIRNILSGKGMA